MANPEAIQQLARLVGRAEFQQSVGIDGSATPAVLDSAQLTRLHVLVDERRELLAGGLLQEAMSSDDVQNSVAALAYLDDRLRFLDDLLTAAQRDWLLHWFRTRAADWG
jgi:hypothetical protein